MEKSQALLFTMDGLLMYRRIFLQIGSGFRCQTWLAMRAKSLARDTLGCTFIFSSIGDALSRAYDSAKENRQRRG
ncbi:hypothetical protein D0O09_31695 [Pseudomonas putida]|nr:hypothetical protein D0O09_31695 [Pseudomonas putida]